jgi:hypothetical protein
MEDKRSIKKVPESQRDVHEKVANQSNSEMLSLSPTTIIKIVLIFRTVFGAAPLFWPDGPCIQLESIRGTSYGSAMTLDPLYSVAVIFLCGFCLD